MKKFKGWIVLHLDSEGKVIYLYMIILELEKNHFCNM